LNSMHVGPNEKKKKFSLAADLFEVFAERREVE
jgi:hypothetical protein